MKLSPRPERRRTERDVLAECRAAINAIDGCRCWRNNTGELQDANGRWVAFGLAVGSADIIACCWGRFVAIECKAPGKKPSAEQTAWLALVREFGGLSGVAWCKEDAVRIVEEARA